MQLKRTAKSCGSDVAVLASRWQERCPADNGGKRAVLRGEHEVSRKAIAQGRPECSCCPVCSCAALAMRKIARETSGAASTRSSLRPLTGGREVSSKPRAQRVARSRNHTQLPSSALCALAHWGGRSSIPEAAVIEPISRGVLDTRLRGDDEIALHRHLRFIGGTKRISAPIAEEWIGSSPHPCATASYCRRKGCGENEAISQRCS